jgi:hypothetical protein
MNNYSIKGNPWEFSGKIQDVAGNCVAIIKTQAMSLLRQTIDNAQEVIGGANRDVNEASQ